MIIPYQGKLSSIAPGCFIAESAAIIGDIRLANDVSIWFGTVLRGDINFIEVGQFSNIQDNSVVHVTNELPTVIGEYVTVGHGAILHGCTVGSGCLIGMGSIVLDNAVIGEGSLVAAGTMIKTNQIVPPGVLIAGNPASIKRETTSEERQGFIEWAKRYRGYAKGYQ
jgi:carbonic anhydrase/acetyltransferase-like protein (isoleucine patch superfamily)